MTAELTGRICIGKSPVTLLLPYLVIYQATWLLNASPVNASFVVLAIYLILSLFVLLELRRGVTEDPRNALFWISIFLFLLAPGVYLEYPSDPWEHFRRIFAWEGASNVRDYHPAQKSAYFFAWSLLGWVDIEQRRTAIGLFAAFTQFVVCIEIFRLASALGFSRAAAQLNVFSFLALFGTGLFGLRYYSLSSTPFALAGSFAALTSVILWKRTGRFPFFAFFAAVLLIALNHLQGLIFLAVTVSGYLWLTSHDISSFRITILLFLSFVIGYAAMSLAPEVLGPDGPIFANNFGSAAILKKESRILSTLGLHGILSLVGAVLLRRQFPILAALTLASIIWLTLPPLFILLVIATSQIDSMYRVLFAMPASLMFTALVLRTLEIVLPQAREKRRLVLAYCAIAAIGLVSSAPNFGRLRFQLHRPDEMRSLRTLDSTAAWLHKNRDLPRDCYIWTDGMTSFALTAHLGKAPWSARFRPLRIPPLGTAELSELGTAAGERKVCGLLIPHADRIPAPAESWVSSASGHWPPEYGDLRWYIEDKDISLNAAKLPQLGWKATEIPPFYTYYEPAPSP